MSYCTLMPVTPSPVYRHMISTICSKMMLCSASSRLNATEEQIQNVDLLILSTICNHGNYFASHRGSEAFLILQVNPVI